MTPLNLLHPRLVLAVFISLGAISAKLRAEPAIAPDGADPILAQAGPSAAAAVSSQAVATQPDAPRRSDQASPPQPVPTSSTTPSPRPDELQILDPRLDPDRPRNCQLEVSAEQTLHCGEIAVVLPAGTYEQKLIVENPDERRAIGSTNLKPQQIGLGYIRYASDTPLKVNGVERTGGLDVPIRKTDPLPVRIWYKKMTAPDDVTKAFAFILPPVALVAGAGAWASGNILLPDNPPEFTEARDYYLRQDAAPPLPQKKGSDMTPTPAHRKSSGLRTP